MPNLNDILDFEEGEQTNDEQAITLQKLINDGTSWTFQGSYGRAMMDAIEAGVCLLGKHSTHDFFRNRIPSRDEVEPGTKGSYEYVKNIMGEDHANMMKNI